MTKPIAKQKTVGKDKMSNCSANRKDLRPYFVLESKAPKLLQQPPDEYVQRRLEWLRSRPERGFQLNKLQKKYLEQGGRCIYCKSYMWLLKKAKRRPHSIASGKYVATPEHIIPKSKGGKDREDNIACACHDCNSRKGDKELPKGYIEQALKYLSDADT